MRARQAGVACVIGLLVGSSLSACGGGYMRRQTSHREPSHPIAGDYPGGLPHAFGPVLARLHIAPASAVRAPGAPGIKTWVVSNGSTACLAVLASAFVKGVAPEGRLQCASWTRARTGSLFLSFQGDPHFAGRAWFVGVAPPGTRAVRLAIKSAPAVKARLNRVAWGAFVDVRHGASPITATLTIGRRRVIRSLGVASP
jgi:hypothetical protein